MYLEQPPKLVPTRLFSAMPEDFRRHGVRSAWADANKGGAPVDCFIEGPAFDRDSNLYIVDIPFGRIFRISSDGSWSLVVEYEGWPNGLKMARDGRILVADYMNGLMEVDPQAGAIRPLLQHRNSESFKGCNDLHIASNGDIYFTDQGQTGLHDPTGRVYRLRPNGRLDCLIANGPSPSGLVLDREESVLFVAMTRDNSVWRVPLTKDGGVAKVGRFCSFFGTSGPDGLAMGSDGRLFVAHASLGHVFLMQANGECVARVKSCTGPTCTNVAWNAASDTLVITDSSTGSVLIADLADA
ncbi:SMP-30/gluconolactonase/LRE family protein [Bradyrhizobium sp. CCGB12]|uniref:SMP-30/gluconolactonase/LRE family protein n=1 Tax=Bradyrhizobium sp. CCGB12 TaxID=2949632 RepID=UPI0020B3FDF3|nr:SMP-30/gluconolactonase/LRE family protein [Bradyrhizobium sp. CCGB12]MCP3394976.1 SMP-30/gluconolactonase/LRE family protein [Bradyrhizobium sp. CCGB12]